MRLALCTDEKFSTRTNRTASAESNLTALGQLCAPKTFFSRVKKNKNQIRSKVVQLNSDRCQKHYVCRVACTMHINSINLHGARANVKDGRNHVKTSKTPSNVKYLFAIRMHGTFGWHYFTTFAQVAIFSQLKLVLNVLKLSPYSHRKM